MQNNLFLSAVLGLTLFTTSDAFAARCGTGSLSNIYNFNVYAIDSITATNSDFAGLTGAGQKIQTNHFMFGPESESACGLSVSVGAGFSGRNGSMDGKLELTSSRAPASLGNSTFYVPRVQRTNLVNHATVAKQLRANSEHYKNMPATVGVSVLVENEVLNIVLSSETIQVVNLSANDIGLNRSIRIIGDSSQTAIINVNSYDVVLTRMSLFVDGLFIRNIIWNFHSAKNLTISEMGGSNSTFAANGYNDDGSLGLQGYVLAPYATVNFSQTKITGSLLANNIVSFADHSGQINIPPVQGPPSPCLDIGGPVGNECSPAVVPPPVVVPSN